MKESFRGTRIGRTQDTQFKLCLLNWFLPLFKKLDSISKLSMVDDLIVRVWIQIKHKAKSRWYPLMIMKRNTEKCKKVSVISKIDSQSYFQECLPEGLTSCSSMEPLGSTIRFHIQFLCLVVWHLQILCLTIHLLLNPFKLCTENPFSEHWMHGSVVAWRHICRKILNRRNF